MSAARIVNLAEARHRRHFARLAAQLLSLGVMPGEVRSWREPEAAHPDVEITYNGPFWQAVIQQDVGETLITRYELSALLDKLEQMAGRRHAPKPP